MLSPKLIAGFLASSGGIVGSSCSVYYITASNKSETHLIDQKSTQGDTVGIESRVEADAASMTEENGKLQDTEAPGSRLDVPSDGAKEEQEDDDEDGEEEIEERSIQYTGDLYLVREKDEWADDYFYKLNLEGALEADNQKLSIHFESRHTKQEISRFLETFNYETTVNPESITDVIDAVNKNKTKLEKTFGPLVFSSLKMQVESLKQ
ncbi:hypothetical protein MHLP_01965 [Candidatus Mycoplasma haematolamae str. Purdue]|uniref:Lipoprotein n=1 Tax=Mycoplasma haematolamae (strain Purdue) TaxID=1212765 RepID=I7BJF5_MYCHA|nr:hypothetical protein [Candidatus Mycoplasma haematolamae]AFO51973.1 hypothetical protein MHLP_01965 [Candidatus Mycoplasma haematolamae str. Purdue]